MIFDDNRKKTICAMLKYLGVAQIIATVVMVAVAYNIEPGFIAVGKQLERIASKSNVVIPEYRKLVRDTSQNIINQEANLSSAAAATDDIARKLADTGYALEKRRGGLFYPDKLADIGADLQVYGRTVSSLSNGIRAQVDVLQEYKNTVLPHTMEVFDEVYNMGQSIEQTAKNLTTGSHSALIITILLCGVLFLLNGIGLICMAHILAVDSKK